ncbi:MAG TPA: cupin domain-containing protein [Methylophilaceae bacterium]
MKTQQEKAAQLAGETTLLGGISAGQFLNEYWQKKPLLIRQAIPGFRGLLEPDELAGLACEDDVQARLVRQVRGKWLLEHGPFAEERFGSLPKADWTLLVQGVNHYLPEAAALLQRFSFIPHARLDDLMVSYAPDGGGVGPHFDSYDVFLLQGMGRRLWRVSAQKDLTLIEDAPLRILKHFDTQDEYVLEPGDMLYLPPHLAHWGIALGDCMTYSIGFRAPTAQELAQQFLAYLQERVVLEGMYSDRDLCLQEHAGEIGDAMVERVQRMLEEIRWDRAMVGDFLGQYLSEPKPHIVFEPPRGVSLTRFADRVQRDGIRLDLRSQALFRAGSFYINGERLGMRPDWAPHLMQLADERHLPASALRQAEEGLIAQLHQWYLAGYLQYGT